MKKKPGDEEEHVEGVPFSKLVCPGSTDSDAPRRPRDWYHISLYEYVKSEPTKAAKTRVALILERWFQLPTLNTISQNTHWIKPQYLLVWTNLAPPVYGLWTDLHQVSEVHVYNRVRRPATSKSNAADISPVTTTATTSRAPPRVPMSARGIRKLHTVYLPHHVHLNSAWPMVMVVNWRWESKGCWISRSRSRYYLNLGNSFWSRFKFTHWKTNNTPY